MKTGSSTTLILLLWIQYIPFISSTIWCSAGSFLEKCTASVVCHFDRDINATQDNFNVVHYRHASDSGTYVLLCNWTPSKKVECKVEDGYSFDYKVTSTLKVDIPSVTDVRQGLYVCQVVPDQGVPVHTCNLTVQSGCQQEVDKEVTRVTQTDPTAQPHEEQIASLKDTIKGHIIAVAVLAVAATLLLTSNIVTCCWARRKLQRNRRHRNFVYDVDEDQQQGNKKNGYLCWTSGSKSQKQKPTLKVEEEELVMQEIVTVKYPSNCVNQSTQHYVDVLDKNFQIGNPMQQTSEVETQLGKGDKFPNLDKIKATVPGVKTGSVERYNNPYFTITHLGKPEVVPVPKVASADDILSAHEKKKAADKELRQTALTASSPSLSNDPSGRTKGNGGGYSG